MTLEIATWLWQVVVPEADLFQWLALAGGLGALGAWNVMLRQEVKAQREALRRLSDEGPASIRSELRSIKDRLGRLDDHGERLSRVEERSDQNNRQMTAILSDLASEGASVRLNLSGERRRGADRDRRGQ